MTTAMKVAATTSIMKSTKATATLFLTRTATLRSSRIPFTKQNNFIAINIPKNIMYEIIDVIHDYLFVTLRLRNVRTGATREWQHWDDLEDWLCEEYGVKELKGLVIDALPKHGGWVATEFNNP